MRTHAFTFAKLALGMTLAFGCSSDKPKPSSSGDKKPADEAQGKDDSKGKTDEAGGTTLDNLDWTQVAFQFTGPKDLEDLARGKVQFTIDTNLSSKGTWNLYYTSNYQSIEGALPIKEGLKATEKSVTWDTMQVDPGTYFVFATLVYGTQVNVRFLQGAITVEEAGADNRTPFISITTSFRNGNNRPLAFVNGAERQLSYVAVEPDGEAMTMDLELSSDDGNTWTSLGIDLGPDSEAVTVDPEDPNLFTVNYTVGADLVLGTDYRLRLKAVDTAGKVGEGITDNFGVIDELVSYNGGARPVRQIFSDNCGGACHFADNPDNNLRLDYYDRPHSGDQGADNRRNQINDRIHRGTGEAGFMPQTGSLPAEDLMRLTMFYWDDFNNVGNDQPDINSITFQPTTIVAGSEVVITFVVDEDDVGDHDTLVTEAFIDPAGTDGNVTISTSGVEPTVLGNGRLSYAVSYTPAADMAPGNANVLVRTDDGRGRTATRTQAVPVVAPPPPP